MEKLKIILLMVITFTFCSCADTSSDKIVKAVNVKQTGVNQQTVTIYTYDLTAEKEKFISQEFKGENLVKILLDAFYQNDYNLKMCGYFVVDEGILINQSEEIFFALNSLKFNQGVNILCGEINNDMLFKLIEKDYNYNPLYNIKFNKDKITDVFATIDSEANVNGGIVISNNGYAGKINREEWNIIQLLNHSNPEFNYSFLNGEYIAKITGANTSFEYKKDKIIINVSAQISGYKGAGADEKAKELFYTLLENDLKNQMFEIYNDISLVNVLNLKWYEKQIGKTFSKVEFVVNLQ